MGNVVPMRVRLILTLYPTFKILGSLKFHITFYTYLGVPLPLVEWGECGMGDCIASAATPVPRISQVIPGQLLAVAATRQRSCCSSACVASFRWDWLCV